MRPRVAYLDDDGLLLSSSSIGQLKPGAEGWLIVSADAIFSPVPRTSRVVDHKKALQARHTSDGFDHASESEAVRRDGESCKHAAEIAIESPCEDTCSIRDPSGWVRRGSEDGKWPTVWVAEEVF